MKVQTRIFGFALLSGLIASSTLLLITVFRGGFWSETDPWPDTLQGILAGLVGFVELLILAILPASLPMTLLGGYIASRFVAKQQFRQPFGLWVARGSGYGLVLGALGSALWFSSSEAIYLWNAGWNTAPAGMIGPGRRETLTFISSMAILGGLAGTFVGVAVGTYCWRATRQLPPNRPLNLTGARNAPAG